MPAAPLQFPHRRYWLIGALFLIILGLLAPGTVAAQGGTPGVGSATELTSGQWPVFWYLLATAIALLVPGGLILVTVAALDVTLAWRAGFSAVVAIGLAGLADWAVGFALQFGGVGLTYLRPDLRALVWEWSPLPADWGVDWGVAGLSGWMLSGELTAMAYALFLGHLPWVFTAALLPVMALRGRAPTLAAPVVALVIGGLVYPLAGNWVQGGGWLSALGRNLGLGHGFVDPGGAGVVFLLAASFGLAALVVWPSRRSPTSSQSLPPTYQPLLAVVGVLLLLSGLLGWLWSNPLQVELLTPLALMRGSVNVLLAAGAGVLVPMLYTWFVAGEADPTMASRGFAAGAIAGLAAAPFVPSSMVLLVGALAGASVPFVTYVLDQRLYLNDATGLVVVGAIPALLGLVWVGLFADGASGASWQRTGLERYLGVTGQGVTGLLAATGYQPDFPGQLQAQVMGIVAIGLWGFLSGLVVCAPLALLLYGLQRSQRSDVGEPRA
jgi:Amt family ammonium transporter